jgi:hypothetical protein
MHASVGASGGIGIRGGLKIRWFYDLEGSSPSSPTKPVFCEPRSPLSVTRGWGSSHVRSSTVPAPHSMRASNGSVISAYESIRLHCRACEYQHKQDVEGDGFDPVKRVNPC